MAYNNQQGSESLPFYESIRSTGGALDQLVPASGYMQVVATPQYLIKIDDIVKSTVDRFEEYTQLNHFGFEVYRFNNPNVSVDMDASGRVSMMNPTFVISNGVHLPAMMRKLINGQSIQEVKVIRLQNIEKTNEIGEEITFTGCYIQRITPMYDTMIFSIRFVGYEHKVTGYDQTGIGKGNGMVTYDVSTGVSS